MPLKLAVDFFFDAQRPRLLADVKDEARPLREFRIDAHFNSQFARN
ncbi:MAG TPA: hypothetical protein VFI31_10685 [Pirellulales bacterium]|nr:hypothetical protein [Pirellulales bacterium]